MQLQTAVTNAANGEFQLEQEIVAVKRETKKQLKLQLQLQRQTSGEIGQ
jgi:hypothetical protein